MLYQGMKDQGIGKEELARRLGCSLTKVDRLLDIQRRSKLEHLDIALRAIDRQPHVASP
jgi:DNA-binding transcriptional regulator LsrR (DeoR family)